MVLSGVVVVAVMPEVGESEVLVRPLPESETDTVSVAVDCALVDVVVEAVVDVREVVVVD